MRKKVLDHGYVELIPEGTWGSDEFIIEAARMSTNKGFLGWSDPHNECEGQGCDSCKQTGLGPGDDHLLKYLWENRHTSPFEMAGATFEIQAPIMVFREWHRHRTQSYSEMSARYTPLPDVNYIPTPERCLLRSTTNKQASNTQGQTLTLDKTLGWLVELQNLYELAQSVYQHGLDIGVPKELARLPVPVARYSRMRAGANLWNWLHFLGLRRSTTRAQWEIARYADIVEEMLKERFPRTIALFQGHL